MLAIAVGALAGATVSAIAAAAHLLHYLLFSVPFAAGLSGSQIGASELLVIVPVAGGLLTGVLVLVRRRRGGIIDPIEANALYGGRMSLTDSLWLTIQNLASNGFGLSAGLEAAYTQLSAGLASTLGIRLKLRREDMRVLVGCGSAGAIAAAFGGPLTGAFYAFEVIIGTYTSASLAPVIAAAIAGALVSCALSGQQFALEVTAVDAISTQDFIPAIAVGMICALLGIVVMKAVVQTERLVSASRIPQVLRPAVGGLLVGCIALANPQVLSAGHGAMHLNLEQDVPLVALLTLFLLKAASSALTIGSGFRGGLFFASLLLGGLIGKALAVPVEWLLPGTLAPTTLALIGMSAFGVAVIGCPLAMTFLALELTGQFSIAALVLAASITASVVARQTFGYSFSTWRFHLRGQTIRSAHDVGWIQNLTVGRLMRHDLRKATAGLSPDEFRKAFPLGSTQSVVVVDAENRYQAMISVAEVHADALEIAPQSDLSSFYRQKSEILLPNMNARQAAGLFEKARADALAVVSDRIERRVLGLLSEAHTLRRYSEELERQRQTLLEGAD
ncbi:chloride channel protein [Pontitalea aquivivens]|uniref:chloride channel protein n=1 Tax=Pontitalea aquivivens TaxID=3388663 RepID=UPI0039709412